MKFSVSICVYINDDSEFFDQALNSVINQTIQPSEIVLVIDGWVADDILEIANRHSESFENFKIIQLDQNSGHGKARQIGIDNCSNDLVALMDSDDLSVPERFEIQIKCFSEHNDVSVVGGYIDEFVDNPENVVSTRTVPLEDGNIKEFMKYRCPMNQVTVMMKKSDVNKSGGYIDWYAEEDYYLWLRMSLNGCKFININQTLVYVRADSGYFDRRGGWQYFLSEIKLQKYMFNKCIINVWQLMLNVSSRFLVQIVLPRRLRSFVYNGLLRK